MVTHMPLHGLELKAKDKNQYFQSFFDNAQVQLYLLSQRMAISLAYTRPSGPFAREKSYLMIVCLAVSETGTSGGKTRVSFQFMTFL